MSPVLPGMAPMLTRKGIYTVHWGEYSSSHLPTPPATLLFPDFQMGKCFISNEKSRTQPTASFSSPVVGICPLICHTKWISRKFVPHHSGERGKWEDQAANQAERCLCTDRFKGPCPGDGIPCPSNKLSLAVIDTKIIGWIMKSSEN